MITNNKNEVIEVYKGNSKIVEIYKGETLMWSSTSSTSNVPMFSRGGLLFRRNFDYTQDYEIEYDNMIYLQCRHPEYVTDKYGVNLADIYFSTMPVDANISFQDSSNPNGTTQMHIHCAYTTIPLDQYVFSTYEGNTVGVDNIVPFGISEGTDFYNYCIDPNTVEPFEFEDSDFNKDSNGTTLVFTKANHRYNGTMGAYPSILRYNITSNTYRSLGLPENMRYTPLWHFYEKFNFNILDSYARDTQYFVDKISTYPKIQFTLEWNSITSGFTKIVWGPTELADYGFWLYTLGYFDKGFGLDYSKYDAVITNGSYFHLYFIPGNKFQSLPEGYLDMIPRPDYSYWLKPIPEIKKGVIYLPEIEYIPTIYGYTSAGVDTLRIWTKEPMMPNDDNIFNQFVDELSSIGIRSKSIKFNLKIIYD